MFSIASNFSAVRAWKIQTFMWLEDKAKAKKLTKTIMANCYLQNCKSTRKSNRLTEPHCFTEDATLLHFRIQYKLTLPKNLQYDTVLVV